MKRKNLYRQSLAFTLALLVLLSSGSWAIDLHFCKGALKTINLFGKAPTCHDLEAASKIKSCCKKLQKKLDIPEEGCEEGKGCCTNKSIFIESDENLLHSQLISLDANNLKLLAPAIFFQNPILSTQLDKQTIIYSRYKTPIITRDISVLNQAFLC